MHNDSVSGVRPADGTDNETDFGGRMSVELEKKVAKGLHVTFDGEARFDQNLSDFGRYQAGLGMTYKINSWLRAGAGYIFIENKNSSGEWKPRHRLYADLRGRLVTGDWTFSLKERLQLTHRNGVNTYQTNPNALTLKSTLKAGYDGFGNIEPYAYVELRQVLNDPACSATWNGTSYSDYLFLGYTDSYLNRVRGCLGAEYRFDKKSSIELYILGDRYYDKSVDTNKEGTKLKSLTYDRGVNVSVGLGYKFSF